MENTNDNFEKQIEKVEEKLKNYFSNYDLSNPKIALKVAHTFKTKIVNNQIAMSLNLSKRDLYLSNLIALFHDYARFEQVKMYDTFSDLNSFDHGDLGAKLLIEDGQIDKFINDLTLEEKEIIRLAVKNHNKYSVEEGLTPRQLLFCNIIRDADKIDIFRIVSNGNVSLNKKIENLTSENLTYFNERKLNKRAKEENFYTSIITYLCFIFDLNYKKSFEILAENNYVRDFKYFIMLWSDFLVDPKIYDCFDEVNSYIKQKIQEEKL